MGDQSSKDGRAGAEPELLKWGVKGLDDVLGGGLPANRLYLVEGRPGVGKTTLALQFLLQGVAQGEPALYIALSESNEEIEAVAASHGWSLDGLTVSDLSTMESAVEEGGEQSVFHHSEVELGEIARTLQRKVEQVRPTRVVFDSLSELRMLAGDQFRYRRQMLRFKQFFLGRRCTVLLLDDQSDPGGDQQLQSLSHGVLTLELIPLDFGTTRRRILVKKVRGRRFREGFHDYTVQTGGVVVHPRLVAAEHRRELPAELLTSGVEALDALLGGGLLRGASTIIMGPAGVGKSTIAAEYVASAAAAQRRSAVYLFDERIGMLWANPAAKRYLEGVNAGMVTLRQIDPSELSPGEFATSVCRAVEDDGVQLVVIDGLNGFMNAMPGEKHLVLQLHELLMYLGQRGVTTLLLVAQHGMMGSSMFNQVDVSYLADAVMLLRYFEFRGEVKQAISVVKRRGGNHERTIREMRITDRGVEIGEPLRQFRGVLTGVPVLEDQERKKG